MEEKSERSSRVWQAGGPFVPAGLLIGMGIGWIFDHLVEGLFIGLGVGLLVMAVLQLFLAR